MTDRILVLDIETDNLLSGMLDYSSFPYKLLPSAKLHCVVVRDVNTGETWSAEKEMVTREWLQGVLKGCTHLVAHNGISFDFPALKLFGVLDYRIGYLDQSDTVFGKPCQIVDTLLLSRLLSPDRYTPEGMGHSLEVWGARLGEHKQDYRSACIEAGYIDKNSVKGQQFLEWTPLLLDYCRQDTVVTCKLFQRLWAEYLEYSGWHQAFKMESKLCDLGVRREHLGFGFNVTAAKTAVADLQEKMKAIADAINPILPPKPRNKGELSEVTPPANQLKTHKAVYLPKVQIKKDGKLSSALVKFLNSQEEIEYVEGDFSFNFGGQTFQLPYYEALVPEFTEPSDVMLRFAERVGAAIEKIDEEWLLFYKGQMYPLPYNEPLESHIEADIDDIDWVKAVLISKNWQPTEFRVRDLTKDSKKQSIPYEKRLAALQRYVKETLEDGKYKEQRLEALELTEENLFSTLAEKIKGNRPVVVFTSPCIRVGVDKDLCPSLVKIGESVAFAKDFALYLTYKHRKNSIAGGVGIDEDWEFDEDNPPNSGYLSQYREVDGRIPTPAILIGAATNRYKHIGVANIPRVTSTYGFEMRNLFGSGDGAYQFSYDFNSLEASIMGNFCIPYTNGVELAKDLLANKPNSIHCKNAIKLGISRNDAKCEFYGLIYGAQAAKIAKMLSMPLKKAQKLYEDTWNEMPALKELRDKLEIHWNKNGKSWIRGIDGRKIFSRSKHSLLNFLFQSTGIICAKYTNVISMQILEEKGYCIDCFEAEPDVAEMIHMHDEQALRIKKHMVQIKKFASEEEGRQFVENWKGEQISPLMHDKSWYIVLPNDISRAISDAILKTEKLLKLRVHLQTEIMVNNSWAKCH
ncbi:MAG: hypothetical protein IM526_02455 [Microcystis sp. M38BS1]|uniref:hypothetical protein n=1 Tax=Microcystis sp. M38BS1 TaxID=2771188 RepID=UPI0031FD477A|nr:hypothetical protein [Microcystis sp. M38BS1]MCA6582519.1 hypothetical protein [Pseudanabaena sp. M34BS1SP1A06MG]